MFLVNKNQNYAMPLKKKSFSEMDFKERQHLQEWICKKPEILGEELLIIQKEFQGFAETAERLDLLALDKEGNLVIIENKLDDSGRDVVWQALKYVSYCASLKKSEILQIFQEYLGPDDLRAEETLLAFLNEQSLEDVQLNTGDKQRVILVAANFRKEVTSTVMWLANHDIDIKCIQVSLFPHEHNIFLHAEQILPIRGVEDFVIKLNRKKQEDEHESKELGFRHKRHLRFWEAALPKLREKTGVYTYVNPSKDNWLSAQTGTPGITYNVVITSDSLRAEIYFGRTGENGHSENNFFLNFIKEHFEKEIEEALAPAFSKGTELKWESSDTAKRCKIILEKSDSGIADESEWGHTSSIMAEYIGLLKKAVIDSGYLKKADDAFKKAKHVKK